MERNQDNDVKRVAATNECLIKNATSYTGNVKIKAISDGIVVSLDYIEEQRLIQLEGSSDATTVKKEDREATETSVIKVKSGIISYFNSENDHSNFNFINKSNSDIKAMDDNTFNAYANKVHTTAVSLGIKIAPYNIVTADITLLKTRIDKYFADLTKTRNAINAITVATANIDKELHKVNAIFVTVLDPLIETFVDTAPDFVAEYKAARKIVHYGVRHLTYEATIKFSTSNVVDDEALRLVKITVEETEDKALTDDFGNTMLRLALAGVYTIICEKYGFEKYIKTGVELGVGDVLTLIIKLTPITIVEEIDPEEPIEN